ncbi:MAG: hypothetical protein HYZ53_12990 [Planctomycetes bacterium]|nr:hypothetical protein [Planctomycetota bacterium]
MRSKQGIARIVAAVLVLYVVGWEGFYKWGLCRIYVPPGGMMVLTAKVGWSNPDPENLRVVDEGVQGVQKLVRGEGRHFYNPFFYDRDTAPHVDELGPEEVGLVESKSGKQLPPGEFLVDDVDHLKGIWRAVLTPGKWRLNPRAFEVTKLKATKIQPGYVGCVTSLSGASPQDGSLAGAGQRGIRSNVLQPGLYYLNPREFQVDSVEIGYREISFTDVSFPSKDGFTIKLDVSVVWGLEPVKVPFVMMQFGNVEQVINKVIHPQVESICRNEGSRYQAKDFIEGVTRERFQSTFTETLTSVCAEKKITVITALVRAIDVPIEIREPIQQAKVAMEESLTKGEQQSTQKLINDLEQVKADVEKGVREVAAETERTIASVRAEGEKKVAEIRAQLMVDVAAIEREIAELSAERTRVLGKAEADVTQLLREAESDKLRQSVDAIGGPAVYANYIFATGLPPDFQVVIRYAGPGTFWTDLPGTAGGKGLESAASLKILEKAQKDGQK